MLPSCPSRLNNSNVGSRERLGLPLSARSSTTAVQVNLDALFPTDSGARSTAGLGESLVLHGWTAGALHRWLRSTTGQWIGVCTILIPRADGTLYRATDQLVPAEALRPRPD